MTQHSKIESLLAASGDHVTAPAIEGGPGDIVDRSLMHELVIFEVG